MISKRPGRQSWRAVFRICPVLGADKRPLGILAIRDAMTVLFEQEKLREHMLANFVPPWSEIAIRWNTRSNR
jgi:hypothetical protein